MAYRRQRGADSQEVCEEVQHKASRAEEEGLKRESSTVHERRQSSREQVRTSVLARAYDAILSAGGRTDPPGGTRLSLRPALSRTGKAKSLRGARGR